MTTYGYKDLIVWQKAMEAVIKVYKFTQDFPTHEIYGLTAQMRRAAVSIPSNIAEGRRRGTDTEFRHFLRIAFGSLAELQTQMLISKQLSFGRPDGYAEIERDLDEISRILHAMSKTPRPSSDSGLPSSV